MATNFPTAGDAGHRELSPCDECKGTTFVSVGVGFVRCDGCGWLRADMTPEPDHSQQVVIEEVRAVAPQGILRGRYRIVRELGRGAHGVSILARHMFLDHPCVLKVLPPFGAGASQASIRRMKNEARAGFQISDPHVVRVLDCDELDGVWYFVTEFIDGTSLDGMIEASAQLSWRQALRMACDTAAGLVAIHGAGLVHRDIKPSNLIIGGDGRTRIGDLGVAGLANQQSGSAELAGTLNYMSPEALTAGDSVVAAAGDLYAWGATFYHLLTGRLPYQTAGVVTGLANRHHKPAAWPDDDRSGTPPWFVATLLRCLRPDPAQRFDSAGALLNHLLENSDQQPAYGAVADDQQALEPRGLAVLPFENSGTSSEDDWLGIAVAELLAVQLSQFPGVYVADREQLLKTADKLDSAGDRNATLLEAGRLVGAATIVSGEFRRSGESVELVATLLRAGESEPHVIGGAAGPISDLSKLREDVLACVVRALEIQSKPRKRESAEPRATLSPTAQERYHRGLQAFWAGDYQKAADLAQESVALDPHFAEPLGFIGACCARLGKYDDAAAWQAKLETIANERGDRRLLAEAWANMGLMHWFKSEYEQARDYCTRAADLARQQGNLRDLAQINNNLGFAYLRLESLPEAETAFRQAIETHRAYGDGMALIAPYNGLGNVLFEQERLDEAASYYQQALELGRQAGDLAKVGISHLNLGRVASKQGDFTLARNEFARSFSALEKTAFWNGLARWYESVADMGAAQGNYEQAVLCAEKRIELARSHSNSGMERAAWMQKARALELMGRMEQAAACQREADRTLAERSH